MKEKNNSKANFELAVIKATEELAKAKSEESDNVTVTMAKEITQLREISSNIDIGITELNVGLKELQSIENTNTATTIKLINDLERSFDIFAKRQALQWACSNANIGAFDCWSSFETMRDWENMRDQDTSTRDIAQRTVLCFM